MLGLKRLGKHDVRRYEVGERQPRRHEPGGRRPEVVRRQPADRGADDEPEAEGGPDDPHPARPLRRRRDVRHVSLGCGNVAAGESRDDPREKQHHVGVCRGEQHVSESVHEHRREEDRAAADAIGRTTQDCCSHELHGREHAEQGAQSESPGAKALRVVGQDRDDDTKPDQVDQHREENDRNARARGRHRG